MGIRRGPDGHIKVVGKHAPTCTCYGCRQAALAERLKVDMHPEVEPYGPPPWLAPMFVGGILFWIGLYWFIS